MSGLVWWLYWGGAAVAAVAVLSLFALGMLAAARGGCTRPGGLVLAFTMGTFVLGFAGTIAGIVLDGAS